MRKTGDYFGVAMIYDRIPNQLIPFDYATFAASPSAFHAVVTNCRTGQAEYPLVQDMKKQIQWIQASSSLPLLSRMVEIKGELYLDGGIAGSIPLLRAQRDGNRFNLLVLTRHRGYRKGPDHLLGLLKRRYRAYPALLKSLATRDQLYNQTLDYIEQAEQAGTVFVIQPQKPVAIKRFEKDRAALEALYADGYADAQRSFAALQAFLQGLPEA